MALPKIDVPTFKLTLPASKKNITFRPFLVKEQKNLLMAMESNDSEMIEENIKRILQNCTEEDIDISTLPLVDVEYYFLNLRAKSVGELIESKYKCNNEVDGNLCGKIIDTSFNLTDVKVDFPKDISDVIQLTKDIGVKLKYPDFRVVSELKNLKSSTDMAFEIVINCIDYVFDGDSMYHASETPKKELISFLESLTKEQFSKIEKFIENVPKLSKHIEFDCPKCGYHHSVDVEGLQDFFV